MRLRRETSFVLASAIQSALHLGPNASKTPSAQRRSIPGAEFCLCVSCSSEVSDGSGPHPRHRSSQLRPCQVSHVQFRMHFRMMLDTGGFSEFWLWDFCDCSSGIRSHSGLRMSRLPCSNCVQSTKQICKPALPSPLFACRLPDLEHVNSACHSFPTDGACRWLFELGC